MSNGSEAILPLVQRDLCSRGLATDPTNNLFTATAGDFAKACQTIADHEAPRIVIVTGFTIPSADPPCGETDGPLGALHLARAFSSLNIPVTIATDGTTVMALRAGIAAAGLAQSVPVMELPVHQADYRSLIRTECGEFNFLIALERVGPNRDGRCYSMRGRDMTELTRPAHVLFEPPRHAVSIGIGDGGNEIGMGKIPIETIKRNIPQGDRVACRVPTDFLIVAGISNWGAYALSAGVLHARHAVPAVGLFDPMIERQLLTTMIAAGPLIDGVTGKSTFTVDGLNFDDYVAVLSQIGATFL